MKSIKPELALASLFAVLAFIIVMVGQSSRNPYFMIAAAALVVATYVTYPPSWMVEVSKIVAGKPRDGQDGK
jgi:hypothetical protein